MAGKLPPPPLLLPPPPLPTVPLPLLPRGRAKGDEPPGQWPARGLAIGSRVPAGSEVQVMLGDVVERDVCACGWQRPGVEGRGAVTASASAGAPAAAPSSVLAAVTAHACRLWKGEQVSKDEQLQASLGRAGEGWLSDGKPHAVQQVHTPQHRRCSSCDSRT